ncbi:hypothetical protein BCR42DRAFT_400647 [Absidia repens]|uniref:Oxidoreductase n=1 Tax=Absidia repens TaxID=90262 RepID=A0A1X2J1M9_9FUNG|nr:hypothetical protein BCR42DRAFT_400647 [Absidia repens]
MIAPVVLVTGCTEGGIGYELCKTFSKQGCRVFATARRIESMKGLEDSNCTKLVLDVTNLDSINECFQKVIDEAGHIDILVNNAGAPAVGALLDVDYKVAHTCIETNVFGVLSVCRVVGRHMAERGSGKIVNVGSIVGYAGTPWAGIYSISKAAVHSMSDVLRLELKPFNVHVTVVAPGSITSNFGNASTKTVNIPENSLYKSVTNFIFARANMSQGDSATPTHVFAEKVVKGILVPKPKSYITVGTNSITFLILYYLPYWIKDAVLGKRLGVNQVKTLTK